MIITISQNIQKNKLVKSWFHLAIIALIIAGIFSIILVALRTPGIERLISCKDFFKISLVVHVDLSVLVWLMSMSSLFAELVIDNKYHKLSRYVLYTCTTGVVLISISPFITGTNPVINNYIPVLDNIFFIIGLSFFFCGSFLHTVITFISIPKFDCNFNVAIFTTKIINFIAFISFFISALKLNKTFYVKNLTDYYELLFWAQGHILQFSYTNLMMISWLVLIRHDESNIINLAFIINLIFTAISLIAFISYEIDSFEFKEYYTLHMKYFAGISPTIVALLIIYNLLSKQLYFKDFSASIINSFVLFFIGGLIGIIITSSNVTIPAHYHGSIVGVTIALMGASYKIIAQFYKVDINTKYTKIQTYLYGFGQLIHIIGLAWSGGYGALRKTPGVDLSYKAKLGMGLMGFGGLLAITAGLMFVVICSKAVIRSYCNNK